MRNAGVPPSFDDIAVALSLAASKFRLDVEQMEMLAARVGVSPMGTALAISELQRNLDLLVHAHHLFKDGAPAEREIRAAVDRKKRGRWSMFARVAAI
jgi:hypothetical protein